MNRLVYKYSFSKHIPISDIEDSLVVAALAAEALHGRAAMRLDASFRLNKKTHTCVIDAETGIGFDIARILTVFITKGYGESSFRVEQTKGQTRKHCLLCAIGAVL